MKDVFLPFFGITNHALPGTLRNCSKGKVIFHRIYRFQTKNFYVSSAFPLKMEAGRDHFRVVKNHQSVRIQKIRQISKTPFFNLTRFVVEEFRCVSFRQRILGNPGIIETVIIVFDVNFGYHFVQFKILNKVTSFIPNAKIWSLFHFPAPFCLQI